MKLGIANRISVVDGDMTDTVNVNIAYSDCVYVFQSGDPCADLVAQAWLDTMAREECK